MNNGSEKDLQQRNVREWLEEVHGEFLVQSHSVSTRWVDTMSSTSTETTMRLLWPLLLLTHLMFQKHCRKTHVFQWFTFLIFGRKKRRQNVWTMAAKKTCSIEVSVDSLKRYSTSFYCNLIQCQPHELLLHSHSVSIRLTPMRYSSRTSCRGFSRRGTTMADLFREKKRERNPSKKVLTTWIPYA